MRRTACSSMSTMPVPGTSTVIEPEAEPSLRDENDMVRMLSFRSRLTTSVMVLARPGVSCAVTAIVTRNEPEASSRQRAGITR